MPSPTPEPSEISVRRTGFGVVHVKADDYRGIGFGVGYAYTVDNRCLLAHRVAEVGGRLSEQLGADAAVTSAVHDITYTALQSDHYYRGWFDIAAIRAGFDAGASEVLDLADGYAAGINRALAEQTASDPCPVQFTAEVTRDDVFRMWVATASLASGEALAAFLPRAAPAEPDGGRAAPAIPSRSRPALPFGSNAWAIGEQGTRGASSVHLYNPHFPWDGIQRLYMVHLTIPGELDVMGATLGGFPVPLTGFTDTVAWGLTFSNAARWTAAELPLDDDLMTYTVDGVSKTIAAEMLSIPVLGESTPRQVPFYRAEEGAIVDAPAFLLGWGPGAAYAARDVNATNTRMVEQFLRIAQAADVRAVRDHLAEIQGVPWSYVVASDAGGDVFFGDISAAPGLTGEAVTQCVTTPVGQLLLSSGIVVTDGARGDCMWTERMPAAQQPSTIRSDYVANSNNTYELPHLEQRLTGFSPVLGGEGAPLSLRASLGLAMISDRLSGSDGMGEPGFTAELARAVFDHNRNRAAEILAAEIAADCQSEPVGEHNGTVVDLTELCAALAAWDQRNTIASRGVAVFRGLWMAMAEAGGHAQLFAIPAAPDAPLTTPSGYTTDPAVRTQVRNALARVALALSEREIPFDAPWGEVHRVDTPAGGIPMPGGLGTAGVFDAMVSSQGFYTFDGWADSLGGVAADTLYGASYLHVVEFGPDGVRASGLLPYSQSTEPSSPWYLDQVPSWSAGEWFAFPYTEAEIAADPALTELLLTP